LLPTFASAATPAAEVEPVVEERVEPALTSAAELQISMAAIPVVQEPMKFEPPAFETPNNDEPETLDFSTATEKKPLGPVLVKSESKPAPRIQTTVDLWKREPLLLKNETEPVEEYARLVTPEPVKKSDEILTTAADIGPSVVTKSDEAPTFGRYGYATAGILERQHRRDSGIRKIVVIAAIVVALVISAGWYFTHRTSASNTAEVQAAAPAPHINAPESVISTPAVPEPATVSTPVSSGPSIATVVKKTDLNLPGNKKKSDTSELVAEDKTIRIVSNGSVPKKHNGDDIVAPNVASSDSSSVGNLLGMVKTAQPEFAFRSSSIKAPQLLKQVAPQFPAFARQMHIQSDKVVLNGTVEKDGSVNNIKVVHGKQVFVQPAISAVKQWKYKAAELNGEPTVSTIEIVVNFVDHN
jgi:TonB family protein